MPTPPNPDPNPSPVGKNQNGPIKNQNDPILVEKNQNGPDFSKLTRLVEPIMNYIPFKGEFNSNPMENMTQEEMNNLSNTIEFDGFDCKVDTDNDEILEYSCTRKDTSVLSCDNKRDGPEPADSTVSNFKGFQEIFEKGLGVNSDNHFKFGTYLDIQSDYGNVTNALGLASAAKVNGKMSYGILGKADDVYLNLGSEIMHQVRDQFHLPDGIEAKIKNMGIGYKFNIKDSSESTITGFFDKMLLTTDKNHFSKENNQQDNQEIKISVDDKYIQWKDTDDNQHQEPSATVGLNDGAAIMQLQMGTPEVCLAENECFTVKPKKSSSTLTEFDTPLLTKCTELKDKTPEFYDSHCKTNTFAIGRNEYSDPISKVVFNVPWKFNAGEEYSKYVSSYNEIDECNNIIKYKVRIEK